MEYMTIDLLVLNGRMEKKKMEFCTNCGQAFAEGAHFCSNCGTAKGETDTSQRKTVYDGDLYKCPNCAERLDSFMTVCPTCGYELRGAKGASKVEKLAKKLESTKNKGQKIDLIRNFYVPNTKEDIYEFVILATSNMNSYDYDFEAWNSKLEQAYQKATLSFGNTEEFQYINQLYTKSKKHKKLKYFIRTVMGSKILQCLLLGAVGIIMVVVGFVLGDQTGDSNSPFYMIALVGYFPIMGAFGYALLGEKEDK
ncbi:MULTISPECIES: zinc ribbon domain-containing protein [Streptococcus]|uniref:zinc ribbon domain-containing protein n=1 Tax=Streptococcus TaxID=1301 RepID=UPI001CBB79E6|nr:MULTISPECIES: zinc ribbon domain-containing protein [Streptococcus]